MGKHSREELADEVQNDRPGLENDITVGKHSRENRQLQEAKGNLHLVGARRISAAEREVLRHTLASHRSMLFTQCAELAHRLGELLAEVQRLDQQLDNIRRSES